MGRLEMFAWLRRLFFGKDEVVDPVEIETPVYKVHSEPAVNVVANGDTIVSDDIRRNIIQKPPVAADFNVTMGQLKEIMPYVTDERVDTYLIYINKSMKSYKINTPKRISAFLSQLAHESGSLKYVEEIASGANYENRKDLGNLRRGDGVRFKGRGLIQITGRYNYGSCGAGLKLDLLKEPDLLLEPINACNSAAWFWETHGCNELADESNFKMITKVINGGYNGYTDRVKYYERALRILSIGS
jgi:putative chitinase